MFSDPIIEETIQGNNGEVIYKHYIRGKFLGKGGFAKVYEFKCLETQEIFAAKIVCKTDLTKSKSKSKLLSEITIHRSLKHPNIVNLVHCFEDAENVYILLELCPNQTMNELIRRRKYLTDLEVQYYMLQIIKAVSFIHSQKVIHRDLKIGNFFLNERLEVKVGDFGLACKLKSDKEKRKTICGTPNYIAPEIISGNSYSYEVDIWSLGVVLYTLIVGIPPFETYNVKKTYNLVKLNAYAFPDKPVVSDEAKSLVTRILKSKPDRRPSLSEILDHEFFRMGNRIPKHLPLSAIAVPPNEQFIRKYMPNAEVAHERPACGSVPNLLKKQPSLSSLQGLIRSANGLLNVWISKWVDYSGKYGIGYCLSNGTVGVCFNDNTNMLTNGKEYLYADKEAKVEFRNCPDSLRNKRRILDKFMECFDNDKGTLDVFAKKWYKTRKALVFKFSNSMIQVIFTDKTELCFLDNLISYLDKRGERTEVFLNNALMSKDKSLKKRLGYAKEILYYMSGSTYNVNVRKI